MAEWESVLSGLYLSLFSADFQLQYEAVTSREVARACQTKHHVVKHKYNCHHEVKFDLSHATIIYN